MKTIGLIGGMSWESSKMYYEFINKRIQELLGDSYSGKSIMITVNFAEIEKLTFAGNWQGIGEIVKEAAQNLEKAGADMILLCTNAIHLVSNAISDNTSVPFLHIADVTAQEINKKGLKKVGLLGTSFVMEEEFYKNRISEKHGIEVIVPEAPDREVVHRMVYDELVKGIFTETSKQECLRIINLLKAQGAEGIIMGCTELPILLPGSEMDIPSFDTSKIHAYVAVDMALKA
ncbi:amino acid racemase [Leptobacterium flavescens]|uniref:Amino acid racemase n=1 Tax=Leptobacterium flavescens TaxID=472055 RepID=A0A6P0UJU2_9FLAO|nr:amino acid racemase [Leptobacterium flavescens]NER13575.1 amino acid racemase [Leptobacterium flavescens]